MTFIESEDFFSLMHLKESQNTKLTTKLIYCTICGPSNVGKSTFLNKILEKNIAPVSSKTQTTRTSIKGILNYNQTQIIFTDTPGVFNVKNGLLEKKIIKNAWSEIKFTDLLLIMTDADTKIDINTKKIIENAIHNNIKFFILINKCDQKKLATRMKMIDFLLKEYGEDVKIFCISSQNNKNIPEVIKYIEQQAYPEDWIYKKNELTDVPIDKIASEKVREYFFSFLHKEIPYQIEVITESHKENEDFFEINLILFYSKESYKPILIGKKGINMTNCIKSVCKDLQSILNKKIIIKIRAKLDEKWKQNWESLDSLYHSSID